MAMSPGGSSALAGRSGVAFWQARSRCRARCIRRSRSRSSDGVRSSCRCKAACRRRSIRCHRAAGRWRRSLPAGRLRRAVFFMTIPAWRFFSGAPELDRSLPVTQAGRYALALSVPVSPAGCCHGDGRAQAEKSSREAGEACVLVPWKRAWDIPERLVVGRTVEDVDMLNHHFRVCSATVYRPPGMGVKVPLRSLPHGGWLRRRVDQASCAGSSMSLSKVIQPPFSLAAPSRIGP